jgi:cobalt-zinc-cadmium efflux system protein
VGAGFVLSETIPRILHPEESNTKGMILFAGIGILVNGATVLKLKGGKSLNERVVSWHLIEDVLGWVVVLIASIVLLFWDIPWRDPALSIAILAYVLYNVVKNLRETLHLFLQGTPHGIDISQIESQMLEISGVESVHHTHVWSMDSERNMLTTCGCFSWRKYVGGSKDQGKYQAITSYFSCRTCDNRG